MQSWWFKNDTQKTNSDVRKALVPVAHKFTFPWLCKIVVLVLHSRSLLTISLVTSTSASTKLLCSNAPDWMSFSSTLIIVRFLANLLALIAAIFSRGMASGKEEELPKQRELNKTWANLLFLTAVPNNTQTWANFLIYQHHSWKWREYNYQQHMNNHHSRM